MKKNWLNFWGDLDSSLDSGIFLMILRNMLSGGLRSRSAFLVSVLYNWVEQTTVKVLFDTL